MRRIFFTLIICLSFSFLGSAFAKDAPKFWIRNLEGKRFDTRKQNQPYVISFFFVNCIPCIKEIPQFYEYMFYNSYFNYQLGLFGRRTYNHWYKKTRRPRVIPLAALNRLSEIGINVNLYLD